MWADRDARRMQRVVIACLGVLASLVAGCAAPATEPAAVEEPTPPAVEAMPVDVLVDPGGPGGCNAVSCWVDSEPQLVFRTPSDAVLQALDLEVGALRGADRLRWELTCVTLADRDEVQPDSPCRSPLAAGEGELPAQVPASGLALPPRTAILLELTYPATEPAVDSMYFVVTGQSRVTGQATVARLPPALVPPLVLVEDPFAADQHSGPCLPAVEPCAVVGGGMLWDERFDGSVHALNVTMTWDATVPADAQLGLRIGGRGPEAGPDLVAAGTSPLVITGAALEYGDVLYFIVYRPDPAGLIEAAGARTPVHLEGTAWVEPWPAEDEVPEGRHAS